MRYQGAPKFGAVLHVQYVIYQTDEVFSLARESVCRIFPGLDFFISHDLDAFLIRYFES